MRKLLPFCAITLAACATTAPPPIVRTEIQRVEVPVLVRCVTTSQIEPIPAPTPVDPESPDSSQLAAAAVADAQRLRLYAETAHALLVACSQP